jgi:hypothetical protein
MMLGTRMNLFTDGAHEVGSRFGFSGQALGVALHVEEVVVERRRPFSKIWETVGEPRLWVVGPYRMGFEIAAAAQGAKLRVFIDYRIPGSGAAWLLGTIFGRSYARWCTEKMAADAARHFVRADHPNLPS